MEILLVLLILHNENNKVKILDLKHHLTIQILMILGQQ